MFDWCRIKDTWELNIEFASFLTFWKKKFDWLIDRELRVRTIKISFLISKIHINWRFFSRREFMWYKLVDCEREIFLWRSWDSRKIFVFCIKNKRFVLIRRLLWRRIMRSFKNENSTKKIMLWWWWNWWKIDWKILLILFNRCDFSCSWFQELC